MQAADRNERRKSMPGSILWAIVLGIVSWGACSSVRFVFVLLELVLTGHQGPLPQVATALPLWMRVSLPAIGGVLAWSVLHVAKKIGVTGSAGEYVEAVRHGEGKLPLVPNLWRTASAAFSIATGAAIGREGSMIQFAAATISSLGRRMAVAGFPLESQVACAAAAAVATVYQAPIAGMFFAAEIVLTRVRAQQLLLLACSVASAWLLNSSLFGFTPLYHFAGTTAYEWKHAWPVLMLAMLAGLLGPLYTSLLRSLRAGAKLPLAVAWSGLAVGLLSLYHVEVWGNADVALTQLFNHAVLPAVALSILCTRLLATSFCVGTGTIGGVFTPTVFAGAALGYLAQPLMPQMSAPEMALLGAACFLAAVTHAPFMAGFMAVELTGAWECLPLAILAALCAWVTAQRVSRHSLYALATPAPVEETPLRPDTPLPQEP